MESVNRTHLIGAEHVRRNIAFGNMMKITMGLIMPLSKLVYNIEYRAK